MIDLTNFVKINIRYPQNIAVSGTRDTVALIVQSGVAENNIYGSYDELAAVISNQKIRDYAAAFFGAGGKKLHIYPYSASMTIARDEIVVASAYSSKTVEVLATELFNNDDCDGIYKKILVGVVSSVPQSVYSGFGLALKYVAAANIDKGYEMCIAAYLSKINAYGLNQVFDYCYTEEAIPAATDDNTVLENCLSANLNINIELAGKKLNVGGNCTDGNAIVNEYMLVLLQQTCTDRLLNLLTQKLKGAKGSASIKAVLENELGNYVTDGYLDVDKVWTAPDLTVDYNNHSYTVIRQGTPIDKGYYIFVVPYEALSAADLAAHKAPPIYLVIADAYGIRSIEIDGEVK